MSEQNPCEDDAAIQALIQSAWADPKDTFPSIDVLVTLRRCGTRKAYDIVVKQLCRSSVPRERYLGIVIIGQFGTVEVDERGILHEKAAFVDETTDLLLQLLEDEQNPEVISAICGTLGHLREPRAVEPLVRLKSHPDADVRSSVVDGLCPHKNPLAIQTLIELSQDSDDYVRNLATAGLGIDHKDIDTPEIRAVLWRNIDDPDECVRYLALQGLALRRDKGIIPRIIEEFATGGVENAFDEGEVFGEMLNELKDEIQDERLPAILEKYNATYPKK